MEGKEENREPEGDGQEAVVSKKNRYRKDKPWDDETVDHWKPVECSADNPLPAPLEESSFATLFPKYREKYIREAWPAVTKHLKKFGILCELNLLEGSMNVKTSRKTWDPAAILKSRDLIKLLARSIPAHQALKIMEDEMYCDIIKIKNKVRNKERFVKRRQRLIGPNGCTLKAIELVTGCYVMVQGNTVSAMGSIKGLKAVRALVDDTMKNVHPIYNIKRMMIKQELGKDDQLQGENWDRFLPQFKKKNVKRKKPVIKAKKQYTPFPPEQTPRKVDKQIETGEYFLNESQKRQRAHEERRMEQLDKKAEKTRERKAIFQAPDEPVKKRKTTEESSTNASKVDLEALKSKLKATHKKRSQTAAASDASRFVQ